MAHLPCEDRSHSLPFPGKCGGFGSNGLAGSNTMGGTDVELLPQLPNKEPMAMRPSPIALSFKKCLRVSACIGP